MKKTRIPKPNLEHFRSGETIELIPAKKGFCIYIYSDMKYFTYIPLN